MFGGSASVAQPLAHTKACAAYLQRENPSVSLVVACHNDDGVYWEDGEVWCGHWPDDKAMSGALKSAFFASEERAQPRPLRKQTEWPAFRASGTKSLRDFEQDYVRYDVRGANNANVTAVITSQDITDGIALTSACNPLVDGALGQSLFRLHTSFLRWQNAGGGA